MEKKLGRKLLRSEIVHHIDGNTFNNKPSNLALTTPQEHGRHEALTYWRGKRAAENKKK